MENEMQFNQFIGTFTNIISGNIISGFIEYFNALSEQGITMSSREESGHMGTFRKDESICIPSGLPMTNFPIGLTKPLWENLTECVNIYLDEYNLQQPCTSHDFKIHRVYPTGGYHIWHHEHAFVSPYRVLAWMIILEAPVGGGETEFMFQSLRIEPEVGKLLIWPAGFTHKHRGNPPLEGQKTYITGWFELTPESKNLQS